MSFWDQIREEMELLSCDDSQAARKNESAAIDERARLCEMERERMRNQQKRLQSSGEREWDVRANSERNDKGRNFAASNQWNAGENQNQNEASNSWDKFFEQLESMGGNSGSSS